MSKPRVFISHSAREDAEALEVIELLKQALQDDFALRIDFEHLKLGVNWRNTLNTWIGGCDAAIVLLSKKALKSAFVAYEASVLTFRENLKVIPVFLSGVDYPDIQASLLAPSDIHGIQAVKTTDKVKLVADVKKELEAVKWRESPVDWQAMRLEELLGPVGGSLVRQYLSMLGHTSDPWQEEDNPRRSLALQMMRVGLQGSAEVLRLMRTTLLREGTLNEVFELVATSWVDLRSAERIKKVAKGDRSSRVLAINGHAKLIAHIYVQRASGMPSEGGWTVVESEGLLSEQGLDELKEKVREVLSTSRNLRPGDSLEAELEFLDEEQEPFFVALPAAGIDEKVMDGLRRAFPTVTFFFLAGTDPLSRAVLTKGSVEFIIPQLEEGFEEAFCTQYDRKRRFLLGNS